MTVKGERFITLTVVSGEVYKINYTVPPKISVSNNTNGSIMINTSNSFSSENGAANYIKLAADCAINNISIPFSRIYIKAEADGDIVIVRCG